MTIKRTRATSTARGRTINKRQAAKLRKEIFGYFNSLSKDGKLVNLHMMIRDAKAAGESHALVKSLEDRLWSVSAGGK